MEAQRVEMRDGAAAQAGVTSSFSDAQLRIGE
jgi:hypothetical protein